ncbi:ABC transporter family protein [Reticulomyxa filosa]|uniref:ABC transporter family protein n=1 Tax=Reticulomyxa filosa TaxID=46433 RepID=X6NTL0_RETFI|nr:ABC transporter family protein [Reticulomyxa filosa]|eukprot:ETO28637.1 ABC transporter family protein [Reticulomyxa filosa]
MKTLEILKGLTREGIVLLCKQVIATIHQPSSEIWNLLDELCLLAEGHCVYFGPTKNVLAYFKSIGYDCPQFTNPADFVINSIQSNSKFFIEQWEKYFEGHKDQCDCHFETYDKLTPVSEIHSSFFTQLKCLFERELKILKRDPRPSRVWSFYHSFDRGSLLKKQAMHKQINKQKKKKKGILYYNLGHDQTSLRNRFGAVFFLTINTSMTGAISTVLTFPEQRLLFERERNNNMYPTTTYVIIKSLVQIPETCVFAMIYLLICYWMVRFDSGFWEMYLSIILCVNAMGSVGLIVGVLAKNISVAVQIFPVTFIPFLLFANYLVSLDQIPVWIRWLQWVDVFKLRLISCEKKQKKKRDWYMINALTITEFRGQTYSVKTDPTTGHVLGYSSGDAYLKSLDVHKSDLGFDWYMMVVLFFAFRLIALLLLVRKNGF